MKKLVLSLLFFVFFTTFLLNIASVYYSPVEKYKSWEAPNVNVVPGYNNRIRNLMELKEALEHADIKFDVISTTNLVFESLIHTGDRRIDIRENWLLWVLGLIHQPISRTQDPHRIVSGGAAICSEAAAVLNYIAEFNGQSARFVGLNGHVISEIQVDNEWRLADPDYGIVFPMNYMELMEIDAVESYKILRGLLLERGFDQKVIDFYNDVLFSSDDNSITEIGVQQSPQLWIIERVADPLKWIISLIFGFILILILFREKSKKIKIIKQ